MPALYTIKSGWNCPSETSRWLRRRRRYSSSDTPDFSGTDREIDSDRGKAVRDRLLTFRVEIPWVDLVVEHVEDEYAFIVDEIAFMSIALMRVEIHDQHLAHTSGEK